MLSNTLGEIDSGLLLLAGVLCLVMTSISMLRRSHARRATARDVTREELARLRDQRQMQCSLDDLLVQLEEVSRRVNAQVDTRFAKLEAAMRDADARIAALKRLTGRAEADTDTGKQRTPDPSPLPPRSSTPGHTPRPRPATSPSGNLREPGPPAAPRAGAGAPAAAEDAAGSSHDRTIEHHRRRIYEMADAGAAPITIADALQVPVGDVELILNLRRFR